MISVIQLLMIEKPATEDTRPALSQEPPLSVAGSARQLRKGLLAFALTLILYITLAVFAHFFDYFNWDKRLGDAIQGINLPGFHSLMVFLSFLGDKWIPFAIVILISIVLILARKRIEGIICLCGIALGAALNEITKLLIGRPRPDKSLIQVLTDVNHNSFPSGHTFFFVEFFGFLFFIIYLLPMPALLRRVLLTLLLTLIALIGMSRVYLGAHWVSDVIGGYLAGTLWLTLMIKVYLRFKDKQAKMPETAQSSGRF
jgi:membrane-associated phospholipid phosphatase